MRRPVLLTAFAAVAALTLAACGSSSETTESVESAGSAVESAVESAGSVVESAVESATSGTEAPAADLGTVKVGASPVPHAQILEFVRDELAPEAGLTIEIVEFDDYVQPNVQLAEGSLDANYFQHLPYFTTQVTEQGYDFDHFSGVHIEPYAAFSEKITSIDELADGATVGITSDPSNQARALDLLVKADVISLKADVDPATATVYDVDDNGKNLEFFEAEPAQLPRSLQDVDLAIINGNYALQAGLNPATDSLLLESGEDNPYANFVAVRSEDIADPALVKLDELLHSAETKAFIEQTWPTGEVLAAF